MIKNFIIAAVIAAGFTGMILISAGSADADRRRDEWQVYDRQGVCTIYSKNMRNGDVMYISNVCSIAIGQ